MSASVGIALRRERITSGELRNRSAMKPVENDSGRNKIRLDGANV
jgi:hypothetical protein